METDKTEVLVHYATKEDLQGVRVELQALCGEMHTLIAQLRTEMALLRADLYRALNAQTWKMAGVVFVSNAATIGAVYYMLNG